MNNKDLSNPDGLTIKIVRPQTQGNCSNVVDQQSFQRQISIEVPVQPTSVMLGITQPTVLAPDSIQHEQEEQQKEYAEFGQAAGNLFSLFNDKNKELKQCKKVITELRTEREVDGIQLKEAKEQITILNGKIEKVMKKAENDVTRTKSEVSSYKNKYLKLQSESAENNKKLKEQRDIVLTLEMLVRTLENKVEENEKTIVSLTKEAGHSKTKWNELQTIAKILNGQLLESKKFTALVEHKCKDKTLQLLETHEKFIKMRTKNEELEGSNKKLVEAYNANKIFIQRLETEQNELNLSFKVMEATISEKCSEISVISSELRKEKNDNKVKENELEKQRKRVKKLKDKVKSLKNENGTIAKTTIDKIVQQVRSAKVRRLERVVSSSSSSSSSSEEEEICSESSSVVVEKHHQNGRNSTGNEAEQPEIPDDTQTDTATIGKRNQQSKFNTGDDVEIAQVSSSSRSGTHDSKQ